MIKYTKLDLRFKEGIKVGKSLGLLYLVMFLLMLSIAPGSVFAKDLRRDPFIPLVDNQGNIRSGQNLFVPAKEVMSKVVLKGILWDEKNPLAVINGKILSESSQLVIVDEGFSKIIIVQKINPDNVILNYLDREFEIKLRKKEKE